MWVDNGEGEQLAIKYNETNRRYHKINVIVNLFINTHTYIQRDYKQAARRLSSRKSI